MKREELHELDIAIVGMAGRFPGAESVDAFWQNLSGGIESIRDLSDDEVRASGVDDATLADRRLVKRAADLRGVELFDATLFGFTPREAEVMDPQFRVFLEAAWTALDDAGHHGDQGVERIGVFAGASPNTYVSNNLAANPRAAEAVGGFQTSIGNERDYLATHVAYRLDLRGPSLVVQTACSTSLVAVHLACQSLLGGECDVALAGGVSISVPQTSGYVYEEGGIASPDGRCRAFDAAAAGCVKGNGAGVVVLRRLSDALAAGDRIRAVIKGSAINNDGSAKIGFTAPSEEGQAAVIAEALAAAGVEPSTIDYVEAHGTATALGDPVEVAALTRAFGDAGARGARCALGSVKTNIGHLDAAAGVAGLIKTVLALENATIPPSLHYTRPNPKIEFASSPFHVAAHAAPWPRGEHPRRAGVSAFGIGGTNAHVILEEAPAPRAAVPSPRAVQVLPLSAASETALAAVSAALSAHLRAQPTLDLADVAYVLQTGRRRLAWRRTVVARDHAEALAALADAGSARAAHDPRRGSTVAFLFPGQGAQHIGMARGLDRDQPVFQREFDRCVRFLQPLLGLDLRQVVFGPEGADAAVIAAAEERLRATALAQPAIFAVSYALTQLWRSWGVLPAAMAGHSLGEIVAACVAGVMSLDDALALVVERGRLMGSVPPGSMLAVGLREAELRQRLAAHPQLALAAVNGPAACVASGPDAAIAALESELSADGLPTRRLRTSHAFHSSMMDPVLEAFAARVARVRLAPPEVPFLSNLTGTWIRDEQATDPEYWTAHLRQTVRFADNLAGLAADPQRVCLEVGPGTTLTSLARGQMGQATIVPSLRHPAGDPAAGAADARALAQAVGQLWGAGVDIAWEGLHAGHPRRRVSLPTYPFERTRHWIEPAGDGGAQGRALAEATPDASPAKHPDRSAWFYVPGWKRSFARADAASSGAPWLVFDDGSPLARALVQLAEARGVAVTAVRAGEAFVRLGAATFAIDPARREDYDELFRHLRQQQALPARVVHLWCQHGAAEPAAPAQDRGFYSLLHLLQALGQAGVSNLRAAVVTAGLFDVLGEPVSAPERATLLGISRVAQQEYAGITCRLVDVSRGAEGDSALAHVAAALGAELDRVDREPVVALRRGHRWVPSYTRVPCPAPAGEEHALGAVGGGYVLTGGTGALELALATRLVEQGALGIAFLGCEPGAEEAVASLRAAGIVVLCLAARTDDPMAVAAAVAHARATFGRLDTVFHTAGSIGGGLIQLKERSAAQAVLAPRLEGTRALAPLLRDGERLVLFSSAISATGVFGQVDYCAASAYLDAFAQSRRGAAGPRVVAIDWGTAHWDRWEAAAGPGAEGLLEQLRAIQESVGITVDEGIDALERALALGEPQVVVSTQDLDELVAKSTSASILEFLEGVGGSGARPADRDGRPVVPPVSATERRVAATWSELLGITPIGRHDNFFEVGGNSLLAIQLASQLRKAFDVDLTIASLFEAADLASLAAAVDAAVEERRQAEEAARLLEEIERLSEDEVRAALAQQLGGSGGTARKESAA